LDFEVVEIAEEILKGQHHATPALSPPVVQAKSAPSSMAPTGA
jgi:hypothetical protein